MTTIENIHITALPTNRKTGPIPVTSRPMGTCPTGCPFLPSGPIGGCYGTGYLFGNARRFSADTTVKAATAKVRRGMWKGAKYLRDRVVGDVVTPAGRLDRPYIAAIAELASNVGVIAFGYTHAWRRFSAKDIAFIRDTGYVMNASVETYEDAALAVSRGLPVALVDEDLPDGAEIAGKRILTCPNEVNKKITCASCGLCAKPDRKVIIRFTPHGPAVKARRAIAAAREEAA